MLYAPLLHPSLRAVLLNRRFEPVDLGAYREVLRQNSLYRRYERFILLNASIRGPFIPFWSRSCWSDVYTNRLSQSTKVGTWVTVLIEKRGQLIVPSLR